MIKVGINGFGRIGRLATRIILQKYQDRLDLVCINTSGKIDAAGWVHLLKYDTSYGKMAGNLAVKDNNIIFNDKTIPIFGEKNPSLIPWDKFGTQVVIEATGKFLTGDEAKPHLKGTVKRVVLSAPPKDDQIPVFVIGVNDQNLGTTTIISCASCTTNCLAPIVKIIDERFGIVKGFMTTVHAYTPDQELLDGSHQDLRRARAAAVNIIPTTTGAAKTTGKVYPKINGVFDGLAIRVPVVTGSLTDFTLVTTRKTTIAEINQTLTNAAAGPLKNILATTSEPLVSSDIIKSEVSALVDLSLTKVIAGDLVKIVAWYDNEWAYANRLVELTLRSGLTIN